MNVEGKDIRNSPRFWLATWFGAGLVPVAPGTMGTLATVPVHFLLLLLPAFLHVGAIAVMFVVAVVCAEFMAKQLKTRDPQIVVIDESVGVLIAMWMSGSGNYWVIAISVLMFRFFDILKPWPIGLAEELPPDGLAIVADDVIAGVFAGIVVIIGTWAWGFGFGG